MRLHFIPIRGQKKFGVAVVNRAVIWVLPIFGLLSACSETRSERGPPQPVSIELPKAGPADALAAFPGSIVARLETTRSFRVAGKLIARPVQLGQHVAVGTRVASLDPVDLHLQLELAQAAVAAAESENQLMQRQWLRYETLRERGHAGASAVDQRRSAAQVAQARLDQARAALDLARNAERYSQLRAEAEGVVTAVLVEPGTVVAAGQPVVRIAADGDREVVIAVPEGQAAAFAAVSQLDIELFARPGRRYAGRLRALGPQADTQRRMHEARISLLDLDEAVTLGMVATVFAVVAPPPASLLVPATALGNLDDGSPVVWTVQTAADGAEVAQPHPVQVVQYLSDGVLVAAELDRSAPVIGSGVHRLRAGQPIRVIARPAPNPPLGAAP